MQPAKIIPAAIYARQEYEGGPLTRFRVTGISTLRDGPLPMHSKSEVLGYEVDDNGEPMSKLDLDQSRVSPDEIKGPWQEYAELVERERLAKARAKEAKKLAEDQRLYLAGLLAGIANLSYSEESVRAAYHGVDISDRAVPAVTDALRLLIAKAGAK